MKASDSSSVKRLYRETLSAVEKARYLEKMKLIDNKDPYDPVFVKEFSEEKSLLPSITYPDIVNYLIFTPSPYTKDDLKAYKSLNCYVQVQCGWVSELKATVVGEKHVVIGKVLHSMRLREKPLNPWIIAEGGGSILASHCDCMAGLGEVCTHAASLMFLVDETVRLRDARTRTEDPNWWIVPKAVKGASYSMIKDIDFTSMRSMKRKFDGIGKEPLNPLSKTQKNLKAVPSPSENELTDFFSKLKATGKSPALLSVVKDFSDDYVPKQDKLDLPVPLFSLKSNNAMTMNYGQLLKHCDTINISVTKEQIACVEELTRDQSGSKQWHVYRAGRVTASKAKQVCGTDHASPSQSLVMDICYPGNKTLNTAATNWGTKMEAVARNKFKFQMEKEQSNLTVKKCGLFISEDQPFIGASPDGVVNCDCCGTSLVEVKCPYTLRKGTLSDLSENYCLIDNEKGCKTLDPKHQYYYQVQTQMGATGIKTTHFVVWTENTLYIEQVIFNDAVWSEICEKSLKLVKTAILPELVGKFYSKLPGCGLPVQPLKEIQTSSSAEDETESTWCYCDQVESGEMIACDDENCVIVWFHFTCLNIDKKPRGKKWFCPDCRKTQRLVKKPISKK